MDNIEKIHQDLTLKINDYIKAIFKGYGKYMPENIIKKIKNLTNYNHIIKIEDYGNISAHANNYHVYLPLSATKVFDKIKKYPLYGINKKHTTTKDNNIINNNTFLTYIYHTLVTGNKVKDYYDDLLLHETMHYCGGDGASVLKEGMNELLTRILAQKYNLKTSYCGYPKEVKLCNKLMSLLGKETIYQLAFIKDFNDELMYIQNKCGYQLAKLYYDVTKIANEEFYQKYYKHTNNFNGVKGVFKKAQLYSKINYTKVEKLINDYYKKHNIKH